MMPRFPSLSPQSNSGFAPLPLLGLGNQPVQIGFGNEVGTRIPYRDTELPVPQVWPQPQGTTPDSSVSTPNVRGASTPDLLILPGQAATGGGLTVGGLALVALLGVGGWFLWKKARGA